MSYTPTWIHPLTESLTVTDTLIVETTATVADLHVENLFVDVAEIGTIEVIDITASGTVSAAEVSAATGSFSSGVSSALFEGAAANITTIDCSDLTSTGTINSQFFIGSTGSFSSGLSAPEILTNIQYVNDNQRDIQDGIDAASSGQAIYLSPGSFGGATVTISGKDNIAIVAPPRGQGAICELSGGRALTINSSSSRISIANLQIEGLLTLASTGNNYFTNIQALSGITIAAGATGNYFFRDCEISGPITVPATFAGLITFAQCNFSGATFSLSQVSPLQVQIAQCLNLPVSRPVNATYGSTNADVALTITLDATVANVETINNSYLYSSTGSFTSLDTTDLTAIGTVSAGIISASTGSFVTIDTTDLTASGTVTADIISASTGSFTTIDVVDLTASGTVSADIISASTGSFSAGLYAPDATIDTLHSTDAYITNLYTDNIIPTPTPGADSPFNGWFIVTSKSLVVQGITSLTGPSGYEPVAGDASSDHTKYVQFDAITQYPKVVAKTYPVLYGEVFEALYREGIYEVSTTDANTILWEAAPGTPSFDPVDAVDYLNSLIYVYPPSNFTVQTASSDEIVANNIVFSTDKAINVSIAKLSRTTQPTIVPYDATAVKMKQISDPEALWAFYNSYLLQNQGLYNPNGSTNPQKDSYFNNVGRQRTVEAKYKAGVTYQYDINHIVCSTTTQTDPENAVCAPTGLTRIHLNSKHYITEGSTIVISGFTGAWAVLNGTHINEIPFSFAYDAMNNGNGHVDQASLAFYANGFCLRFDSSALPQETTGPSKGYATYTGNPKIRVTHQLTADISYAKFVAALLAYHREAFGTTEHAALGYLIKDDGTGVPLDDWEDTAYLPAYTSKLQYFNNWLGVLSLYSNTTDMAELWLPADHYDMRAKFITAVSDSDVGINVAENYVDSLNQLWYSFGGSLTTATDDNSGLVRQLQVDTCATYGIADASTVSFTHTVRGAAAPSASHYPFGASPLDDPRSALNFFNFGVIKSALTAAKTVGYLNISASLPYLNSVAGLMWERGCFFPDGTTYADSLTWPNFWVGLWAQPLAYIMKWFVAQNCTHLIVDNSVNYGGYPEWIAQHVGEDRFATNKTSIFQNVENQLAPREEITGLDTFSDIAPEQPLLECSFINTTWGAGSVWNLGQLAWIQSEASYSAGNVARFLLLGDGQDDVISATMTLKVLGSFKGWFGGAASGLSYPPNNVLGNISDTYLYTAINGELDAQNEYNITTAGDYTALNHISATSEVSANSSTLKGAGNAWIVGVETLVYPDFGFTTNPRAILTGWTGPQNPDVDDFTTWRHAYLEESIKEILLTW